jgi:hypothetical protein
VRLGAPASPRAVVNFDANIRSARRTQTGVLAVRLPAGTRGRHNDVLFFIHFGKDGGAEPDKRPAAFGQVLRDRKGMAGDDADRAS